MRPLGIASLCLALSCSAHAGAVLDKVRSSQVLRVCIWPDYYGITYRNPKTQTLGGIDIEHHRPARIGDVGGVRDLLRKRHGGRGRKGGGEGRGGK